MPYLKTFERRHLIGLDGLRAVAAITVIVFHVFSGYLEGGFLGVDVFFIISGFLITSLLINEERQTKTINLKKFWMRRIRRLFPALFLVVLVCIPFAWLAGENATVALKRQILGTFTYTYNWWEIASGSGYFNQMTPSLFANFWTLAVEEQFYLIWPILLIGLFILAHKKNISTKAIATVPLVMGIISVSIMVILAAKETDFSRVYLGTDSHSFGLMMGACLAFILPNALNTSQLPTLPKKETLSGIISETIGGLLGWVGLTGIIILCLVAKGNEKITYPWVLLGVGFSASLVIYALAQNTNHCPITNSLRKLLNTRVLVWLGQRSYGLYLWHWPIWVILAEAFHNLSPLALGSVSVILTILCAGLSYRFIEEPIQKKGFKKTFNVSWKLLNIPRFLRYPIRLAIIGVTSLLLCTSTQAILKSPATSDAQNLLTQMAASHLTADTQVTPSFSAIPTPNTTSATPKALTKPTAKVTKLAISKIPKSSYPEIGAKLTLIGDSVTEMAESGVKELFPGAIVDGKVNRNSRAASKLLNAYKATGKLREYVAIGLSINANMTADEIANMVKIIGPNRKLILLTGYGPKREYWIFQSNDVIRAVAPKYPNQIAIAEWDKAIADKLHLLYGDKVHPKPAGAKIYAHVILQAIQSFPK